MPRNRGKCIKLLRTNVISGTGDYLEVSLGANARINALVA